MKDKSIVLLCVGLLVAALAGLAVLAAIGKFNYAHPEGIAMDVTNDGVIMAKDLFEKQKQEAIAKKKAVGDKTSGPVDR